MPRGRVLAAGSSHCMGRGEVIPAEERAAQSHAEPSGGGDLAGPFDVGPIDNLADEPFAELQLRYKREI